MSRFAAILTVLALTAFAGPGCKKKADTSAGAGAGGDRDRLQGTWAVESVDDGRPTNPDRLERMKRDRLKFEGDTLTIVEDGDWQEKFTVTLEEGQDPKVMTLTEVLDNTRPRGMTAAAVGTRKGGPPPGPPPAREPEKLTWIYKFEGDTLVIAFSLGGEGAKPTEFKGKEGGPGSPGVVVVTLKKTDAPPPAPRPRATTAVRYGTKK